MKPLADAEFDTMFRKFLLKYFPDENIFKYELDEIAWFLNQGTTEVISTTPVIIWACDSITQIVNQPLRVSYKSEQQAYLTYIIKELYSNRYTFEVSGNDLIVLRDLYFKNYTIEGYFDAS